MCTTITASSSMRPMLATAHIYTFKAGLFARLAHDLRLHAQRFEIVLEHGKLKAWFDADSLRVDGVMQDNVLQPSIPSDQDKQRIEATLHNDILQVANHARIEVTGEVRVLGSSQMHVVGRLRLHGQEQPLEFDAERNGEKLRARVALTPSRFGIEPYKALAGAIRLQDRVLVEIELELGDIEPSTLVAQTEPVRFSPLHEQRR
jgi:polyisoprenoid-binding protein YceI